MAPIASLAAPPTRLNVADRLAQAAAMMPNAVAVACPRRGSPKYPHSRRGASGALYSTTTFAELDADATRIARGLLAWGVPPGTRLALLVRPGIEFVTLVFALLRAGMVIVLVDPGLGRRNMIRCLSEVEPEGFVAIPAAQSVRTLLRHKFPRARWNVTVGRRWFWSGKTLDQLRIADCGLRIGSLNPQSAIPNPKSLPDSPAAIIFTSGSTGPAKGVLYSHRMFDTQVADIQSHYGIEPGSIDLSCFPLFALFNSAMGVTTVLPEMDFSRPASADPKKLLAAANDWQVTQAFASPAVWRAVSEHCARTGDRIPSLKQVFSCGAPVPADVIRGTLACVAPDAKMHTPYGATECLPVSTIEAREVLDETAAKTDTGAGVCVGRKFDSLDWRVIRITDAPIATLDDAEELPPGQIGELIVRGPQASPQYVTAVEKNALAKIAAVPSTEYAVQSSLPIPGRDHESPGSLHSPLPPPPSAFPLPHSPLPTPHSAPWHRMGDVGYLDDQNRFWYCGRKAHRVETATGTLFAEPVEGIFNSHPEVKRSALIGIGKAGDQIGIVCILPMVPIRKRTSAFHGIQPEGVMFEATRLGGGHPLANQITAIVYLPSFPVDVRHNSKILRELLRDWACHAILDDIDLYPSEVTERMEQTPNMLKKTPPNAVYK